MRTKQSRGIRMTKKRTRSRTDSDNLTIVHDNKKLSASCAFVESFRHLRKMQGEPKAFYCDARYLKLSRSALFNAFAVFYFVHDNEGGNRLGVDRGRFQVFVLVYAYRLNICNTFVSVLRV